MIETHGGEFVGDCGLTMQEVEGEWQVEAGWHVRSALRGQGYATEAASALLRYTFMELGLHRVIATLDTRNAPSAALLERLGMRREGHFVQAYYDERHGEWTDEYQYAILRAEWARGAAQSD